MAIPLQRDGAIGLSVVSLIVNPEEIRDQLVYYDWRHRVSYWPPLRASEPAEIADMLCRVFGEQREEWAL